jgi:hypothetical protein
MRAEARILLVAGAVVRAVAGALQGANSPRVVVDLVLAILLLDPLSSMALVEMAGATAALVTPVKASLVKDLEDL